jgi:hypothetical protein
MQGQEPEGTAAELCAVVYLNGKVDGHFQMSLDHLHSKCGLSLTAIDAGLAMGEQRDWVRRSRSAVALKAAGIYVAKGLLALPR